MRRDVHDGHIGSGRLGRGDDLQIRRNAGGQHQPCARLLHGGNHHQVVHVVARREHHRRFRADAALVCQVPRIGARPMEGIGVGKRLVRPHDQLLVGLGEVPVTDIAHQRELGYLGHRELRRLHRIEVHGFHLFKKSGKPTPWSSSPGRTGPPPALRCTGKARR